MTARRLLPLAFGLLVGCQQQATVDNRSASGGAAACDGSSGCAGSGGASSAGSAFAGGSSGATGAGDAGTVSGSSGTGPSAGTSGASAAGASTGGADAGSGGGGAAGAGGSTAGSATFGGGSGGVPVAAGAGGAGAAGGPAGSGGASNGEPFKGVANSPCDARKLLDVSWYYNWTESESEPCADGTGGEFVPMIWGHSGSEQTTDGIASAVAGFSANGKGYVLGFNEPDNPSQSNIPVATAMTLLPAFDDPAIRIVSPATAANANPGQAWFTDFMSQLEASSLRVDVLAIHWYGWNAGSCDASAKQLESYIQWVEGFSGERPIWITEWGCLNQSAPDVPTVTSFFTGAVAMFARHPRVERYAWYPWSTNCELNESDGSLTALGEAYAAAPAYR